MTTTPQPPVEMGRLSLTYITLLGLQRLCTKQPDGKTSFSTAEVHRYIADSMASELDGRSLTVGDVSVHLCKHVKTGHAARIGSGLGCRYRKTTKLFYEGYKRRRAQAAQVKTPRTIPATATVCAELEDWLFGRKPPKAKRQSKEVAG